MAFKELGYSSEAFRYYWVRMNMPLEKDAPFNKELFEELDKDIKSIGLEDVARGDRRSRNRIRNRKNENKYLSEEY